MKMTADISSCENAQDKVLSVCECDADGYIVHEVIIQRAPKEFDILDDAPGPKISCDELGLELAPGPEDIIFSNHLMTVVLSQSENVEIDISGLDVDEQSQLKVVAEELFR